MIGFLAASVEGTRVSWNRPVVYHMRGMQKICGWLGLTDQSHRFEWKADLAEAGIVFLRYRLTPMPLGKVDCFESILAFV